MTDDLDIRSHRNPGAIYALPAFWAGARATRLQIAEGEAHPRDAADHRRIADDYQKIALGIAEGRVPEDIPEFVAWRARRTTVSGDKP